MARKRTPEQQVKTEISEYLASKGYLFWWAPSTGIYDHKINKFRPLNGKYQRKGVADILGVLKDGTFFAIECKSPQSNRVSEDQKSFIEAVNAFGAVAIVARSVDDVIRAGF